MNEAVRKRMAWGLGCKPEEVPEDPKERTMMKDARIKILKAKKLEVKHE